MTGRCWDGRWVTDWLGVRVQVAGSPPAAHGPALTFVDLAGLAVRRNPCRAHLVVSRVLGKHIPVDPLTAVAAGHMLGREVGTRVTGPALILGYAETATALGHLVADCLPLARYVHSTRREVPGIAEVGGFDETHSHAVRHLLLPSDPRWLAADVPVVVVDDELTTGRTVTATIREFQRIRRRDRYVVACLLDLRTGSDRAAMERAARELGTAIEVVSLVTAELTVPCDAVERGQRIVEAMEAPDPVPLGRPSGLRRIDPDWPGEVPLGGRHGFAPHHRAPFSQALNGVASEIGSAVPPGGPLLVLGTEELMYAPMMLAERLARTTEQAVRFSSTTRSPVLPLARDGYAIRTRLSFAAHDGPSAFDSTTGPLRFAYNVMSARCDRANRRFQHIVVVVDESGDTPALWDEAGLVEGLRRVCGGVSVVVLPDSPKTAAR